MPGRNHARSLTRGFVAVALLNVVLSLVLVASTSAQDKKMPVPAGGSKTKAADKLVEKSNKDKTTDSATKAGKSGTPTSAEKGTAKSGDKTTDKTTDKSTDKAAKPSVGKVTVWELQQQCKAIKEVNCMISPDAVRIRADKMNITFLFKAPKWDAYMFNTDTKNFCSFPYEEWRTKGFFSQVMKQRRGDKEKKAQYKLKKTGKSQQIAGKKSMELAINTEEGERYATIWTTSSAMVPKQFSEVIGSLVQVPIKESGAPLRVEVKMKNSHNTRTGQNTEGPTKIEPVLDTSKIIEKQVDASIFDQPVGYKKVRDEMALLFAEKEEEDGGGDSMFSFEGNPKLKKKPLGVPR